MDDDDGDYFDPEIDEEEEEEDEDEEDDEFNSENTRPGNLISHITGANRRFLPRMTSYEWARSNEVRASQIEVNSPVGINTTKTDSLDISEEELLQHKCPLYLGRPVGDGSEIEVWHTNELTMIDVGLKLRNSTPIQSIQNLSIDEILNYESQLPKLRQFTQNQHQCKVEKISPINIPEKKINLSSSSKITPSKSSSINKNTTSSTEEISPKELILSQRSTLPVKPGLISKPKTGLISKPKPKPKPILGKS